MELLITISPGLAYQWAVGIIYKKNLKSSIPFLINNFRFSKSVVEKQIHGDNGFSDCTPQIHHGV